MLSSSLYAMLKLSKTSSPQKLFNYGCVTLQLSVNLKISIQLYFSCLWTLGPDIILFYLVVCGPQVPLLFYSISHLKLQLPMSIYLVQLSVDYRSRYRSIENSAAKSNREHPQNSNACIQGRTKDEGSGSSGPPPTQVLEGRRVGVIIKKNNRKCYA